MPSYSLAEYRPLTIFLHRTLFWACCVMDCQLYPAAFISSSTDLLQLFLGRPLFLLPCGFHRSACLVMFPGSFLSWCPIQVHFLFFICIGGGSWFVTFQRSWLLIRSGQWIFNILRRHLFTNDCMVLSEATVVRQVSDPYRRTAFTLELKILYYR